MDSLIRKYRANKACFHIMEFGSQQNVLAYELARLADKNVSLTLHRNTGHKDVSTS